MGPSELVAAFKAATKRSSKGQYEADLASVQTSLNEAYGEQLRLERTYAADGSEVVTRTQSELHLKALIPALEHRKRWLLNEIDQLERGAKLKADEALAKTADADLSTALLALDDADQARNRAAMALVALLERLMDPDVRKLLPSDPTANRRSTIIALLGERLPLRIGSLFASGHSLSIPEVQSLALKASRAGLPAPVSPVISKLE